MWRHAVVTGDTAGGFIQLSEYTDPIGDHPGQVANMQSNPELGTPINRPEFWSDLIP